MLVRFDAIFRRNNFLASINGAQAFAVVWINQAKLQLRDARELISRLLNLSGVQSWNLDKNPIAADRTDDWFAAAKIIDALANDLDRLVEHALVHFFVAALQPDEEGRAALNVEAERDFFLWRPDRDDAESDEKQHQRGCEQVFPEALIGRKVPPEENEHDEPDKKCQPSGHFFVIPSGVEESLTV